MPTKTSDTVGPLRWSKNPEPFLAIRRMHGVMAIGERDVTIVRASYGSPGVVNVQEAVTRLNNH